MSICLSRIRDTRIEKDSDNRTSSKDLLVRSVFEELPRREDMKHEVRLRALLAWLVQECFRRRHGARSAVIGFVAWFVQALELCSLATEGTQECFRGAPRRQAFSVVGIKETWRTLSVSEGQRPESHTKTLMEGGLCPKSTKPLARDWREVWRVV